MRMTAAVLREIGVPRPYAESKPTSIEEVELDPPGDGEVLVKIGGGGLCHTDLPLINASRPRPLPMVLGHEGAGDVVEASATSASATTLCSSSRPPAVGACAASRAVRLHDLKGNDLNHLGGVSCFAEYALVDRGTVVKIDHKLPLDEAAIFGAADRRPFAGGDQLGGTTEEKVAASDTFLGYCGRYVFRGDRIEHEIEISSFPNWCGERQERTLDASGGRLCLSTPPIKVRSVEYVAGLIWERPGT